MSCLRAIVSRLRSISINKNPARFIKSHISRAFIATVSRNRIIPSTTKHINHKLHNRLSLASRAFSTTTYPVNYNDPTVQLAEENPKLNYKLTYQYGLPTAADIAEYDEFHDQIWYGREGHEMVFKGKEASAEFKYCDVFLLRDYHTNKIMGANAIKRCSSTLDTILNTNKFGTNVIDYTIRRNTAISPEFQGKGYGKVIRVYSKYLDDLHTGDHGVSITDVQVQNVASLQLQLKSGFEITGKGNMYFHYRSNKDLAELSYTKYDMYKIEPSKPEWDALNILHADMIRKYGIIDLSVTPSKVHYDPVDAVYVIKPSDSETILAAFQVGPFVMQMKAPNRWTKYAMDFGSKLLDGMDGTERDFKVMYLAPMYIDYDNQIFDVKGAVSSLITFMLKDQNRNFAVSGGDTKHPYVKYVEDNKNEICGRIGSLMGQKDAMNFIMKFSGLDEGVVNMIKNNPITIKPPHPLAC